jgi:hypothetical protein
MPVAVVATMQKMHQWARKQDQIGQRRKYVARVANQQVGAHGCEQQADNKPGGRPDKLHELRHSALLCLQEYGLVRDVHLRWINERQSANTPGAAEKCGCLIVNRSPRRLRQ